MKHEFLPFEPTTAQLYQEQYWRIGGMTSITI